MKAFRLLALASVCCFGSLNLSATLMTPLPIEELAQRAELVLHGKVTAKSCARNPDGRIVTHVQLEVSDVWKGTLATNSISIVHGGGTVGNRRVQVSGQVEYTVGEEVVAFLLRNQRGEGVTLGLAQGKFHVWNDKTTGEKFAHNIFHGATEKSDAKDAKPVARLAINDLAKQVKGGAR